MRLLRPPAARARRDQTGAAAVEFALLTPVLTMLIFGMIAFGIVFAQQLALGNAARQTARYAVVADRTCNDIVAEARRASNTINMKGTDVTVTVTVGKTPSTATNRCAGPPMMVPCLASSTGDNLYVRVGYVSELIIPFAPSTSDFDLYGDGVFRCEFS